MIIDIFTQYVEKNINRLIGLNIIHSPERLFHHLATSLEEQNINFSTLNENEYLEWYQNVFHLKYFSDLIKEEEFTEVILHNNKDINFFNLYGFYLRKEIDIDPKIINLSIEILTSIYKKPFSLERPFSSFQIMFDNHPFRISLNHYSTTESLSHRLYLRSITTKCMPIDNFCHNQEEILAIKKCLRLKKNIIVAGSTGSGKTSLIRSLLSEIKDNEHLIIIEDTKEIETGNKNITHLLARDERENDIHDFCKNILRMRPDRIILGEIRSNEVIPLLLNLNSGHKGLLTSIHANSAVETIDRLTTLFCLYAGDMKINFEQVLQLIASNIDYIIFMDKGRISEMIQINGCHYGHFTFDQLIQH